MLSFKVTYALQLLTVVSQSDCGLSIMDLRNRFTLLPSGTIISAIVRRLESGGIIGRLTPRDNRYCLLVSLDDLTLYDLVCLLDGRLVLGSSVGFDYWSPGYLDDHPYIVDIDSHLEAHLSGLLQSVTVGHLLTSPDGGDTNRSTTSNITRSSSSSGRNSSQASRYVDFRSNNIVAVK